MHCEWENDDLMMVLLLLRMCSDDYVAVTPYLVENGLHLKIFRILMSNNIPGVLECALCIIKECVERLMMLLPDDVLVRIWDVAVGIEEGDIETLKYLCLAVIRLSFNVRGGSTPGELERILEIAKTCGYCGTCEAVRIISEQMFKDVEEATMEKWFKFVIENSEEMPDVAFPAMLGLRRFLELSGRLATYRMIYKELELETFVIRQLETLEDADFVALHSIP